MLFSSNLVSTTREQTPAARGQVGIEKEQEKRLLQDFGRVKNCHRR